MVQTVKFGCASTLLHHKNNLTFNYQTSDEMRECVVLWLDQGWWEAGRKGERQWEKDEWVRWCPGAVEKPENKTDDWMNGTVMKRGGGGGGQNGGEGTGHSEWLVWLLKRIGEEDKMSTVESQVETCGLLCLPGSAGNRWVLKDF